MDKNYYEIVDELCQAIADDPHFQIYLEYRNLVKNDPEAMRKIDEIREYNLRLQSAKDSDEAYDLNMKLEKKLEELYEDSSIYNFLESENRFIGAYQEAMRYIVHKLKLDQ